MLRRSRLLLDIPAKFQSQDVVSTRYFMPHVMYMSSTPAIEPVERVEKMKPFDPVLHKAKSVLVDPEESSDGV